MKVVQVPKHIIVLKFALEVPAQVNVEEEAWTYEAKQTTNPSESKTKESSII